MTDPRKPIVRPDPETQEVQREIAYAHLIECTTQGARSIGCTGASFVILGLRIWAQELAELDGKASAQMLRALADIFDPSSNHKKKLHAEKKRRAAVQRLLAAVDLDMSTPSGRA